MKATGFRFSTSGILNIVLAGFFLSWWCSVSAQTTSPQYTVEQAAAGKTAYELHCTVCHGEGLAGGEFGPALQGPQFRIRWGGRTVDELYLKTATTMPVAAPRSLDNSTYTDLLAYILQQNNVTPGVKALPEDPSAMTAMILPAAGGLSGVTGGMVLPMPPDTGPDPLADITPVTDAMLADPPDGDWLTWRRSNDARGFSPLQQVNRDNVKGLRMVWSWTMPYGPNQVPLLIHDGVLFSFSDNDIVQAMNAATGDLLWQYTRWLPDNPRLRKMKRSIAIYGNRLFVPTSDTHVVALDIKTGSVVWDTQIGDPAAGYTMTGGPMVAGGKVMIGTQGFAPGGNYISALDADSGTEVWRFYTIARPGQPGGNSWNGLPVEKRQGASVWVPGSYDSELDLVYFGVAQTYDTEPLRIPSREPGITNDALYTDTTLALDPDTGDLIWYYQHLPADQWDLDYVFERHILTLPVKGKEKKVIVTGGKIAIFDVLEAETGKYLFSLDMGIQTLVSGINPETGAKRIDPALIPGRDKTVSICPHAGGAKNWIPDSYNPDSRILYVALMEWCMDMAPVPEGSWSLLSSGAGFAVKPMPGSDGRYGRLQAVNLETRETVWIHRQRAPLTTGILATAGGVVFVGGMDRYFTAYDDTDGRELWHTRLNDIPNSTPVSFAVDGRQYIAITTGHGAPLTVDRTQLVPEIRMPSDPGAMVWVFALNER